jgi:hypothetical protein
MAAYRRFMKSLRPARWRWQWTLVLLILALGLLGILEPKSAEAAKSMASVTAMLGIGWFIWHLMNYE